MGHAQEQNSKRLDMAGHYRLMAGAVVISLVVLGLVAVGHASALLAVPFILHGICRRSSRAG